MLELIRGRRLKERYALLWLVTGVVLLVLSAWRGGLNTIAGWLGVETYPPAILFAVATLFIIIVLLHYSTVLSQLDDQNMCWLRGGAARSGGRAPGRAWPTVAGTPRLGLRASHGLEAPRGGAATGADGSGKA